MSFSLSTLAQPYILAAFIYAGILIGALFSIFRIFKKVFGGGKFLTAIIEVLFVLFSAALIAYVMLKAVAMRLRGYYIFGVAIGLAMYITAIYPLAGHIHKKFIKKVVDKKDKSDSNNKEKHQKDRLHGA